MKNQLKRMSQLILTLLVFGMTACSEVKTVEQHFAASEKYLESNDYGAAIIELKNAVKLEPQNADARFLLGKLYLNMGNMISAEKELYNSIKFSESIADEQVALYIESLFFQNEHDDVVNFINANGLGSCDECAIMASWSLAFTSEVEEALSTLTLYESIIGTNLTETLSHYYQGDLNTAIEALSQVTNLDSPVKQLVFSYIQLQAGNGDAAEALLGELLSQRKQLIWPRILLIQAQIQSNNLAGADENIASILKINSKQAFVLYMKALVHFEREEFELANESAAAALANGYVSDGNRLLLGIVQYKLGNYESAYANLKIAIKDVDQTHLARKVFFAVQLKLGKNDEVGNALLDDGNLSEIDIPFINQAILQLAPDKSGVDARKKLVGVLGDIDTKNQLLSQQKALMQLSLGDDRGITTLNNVLKNSTLNESSSYLLKVYQYLRSKNADAAIEQLKEWQAAEPDNMRAVNLEGAIQFYSGNKQQAKKVYDRAISMQPHNPPSLVFYVKRAIEDGDFDLAKSHVEELLEHHPTHLGGLRSHILINMNTAQSLESSLKYVKVAQENKAATLSTKLLYAGLLVETGDDEGAKVAVRELELNNADVEQFNQYWEIQYTLAANESNNDLAIDGVYKKWQSLFPKATASYDRHAFHLASQKKYDKAIAVLKTAHVNLPFNSTILAKKATYLMADGKLAEASEAIESLSSITDASEVFYLRGIQFSLQKQPRKAIEQFNAHYKAEASPYTAFLISLQLSNLGDNPSSFLENHLERFPDDVVNRKFIAEHYIGKDNEQAISHYQRFVTLDSTDPGALNNLAWLLAQKGQFDNAKEYSQKAYRLNSDDLNIVDTHLMILIANKNYQEAKRVIDTAKDRNDQNGNIQLYEVELLAKLGNKAEARAKLNSIQNLPKGLEDKAKKLSNSLDND